MKNLATLLLCVFLIENCSLGRIVNWSENQKLYYVDDDFKFEVVDHRVILRDSSNLAYILDIGGSNAFFCDVPDDLAIIDSAEFGVLFLAGGERSKKKTYLIDSFSLDFFQGKDMPFTLIPSQIIPECYSIDGMIGSNSFEQKMLMLNFSDNVLSVRDSFDVSQFVELKVINLDLYDVFKVEVEINGVKVNVKLDTGTPTGVVLNKRNFKSITMDKKIVELFHLKDEIYFSSGVCSLGDGLIDSIVCVRHSRVKDNLLGVDYMKRYNWILDYKNEKVFVQPSSLSNDLLSTKTFQFRAEDGGLYLVASTTKNDKRFFNKKVLSVDGKRVLKDNYCMVLDRINNCRDWHSLNIVFED